MRTDGFELESTSTEIQINNYDLPPIMREGDIVLVGPDVRAVIIQLARTSLLCEVKSSGVVTTNSVVKIPAVRA